MLTESEIRQWLARWESVAGIYGAERLDKGFLTAMYLVLGDQPDLVAAMAAAKKRVAEINAGRQIAAAHD